MNTDRTRPGFVWARSRTSTRDGENAQKFTVNKAQKNPRHESSIELEPQCTREIAVKIKPWISRSNSKVKFNLKLTLVFDLEVGRNFAGTLGLKLYTTHELSPTSTFDQWSLGRFLRQPGRTKNFETLLKPVVLNFEWKYSIQDYECDYRLLNGLFEG